MQCKIKYSQSNQNSILPKTIFLSLLFILSMSLSFAHEPDPDKNINRLKDNTFSSNNAYFSHIHGIGYSNDGGSILVASHVGIKNYTNGKWIVSDLPAHDYMGFSSTDEGFYSSGHPSISTDLLNPLGLVKVNNTDKKLTLLAFAGVFDFHQLAAGYYNHAIYVINHKPHTLLKPGLNYTLDEGKTWNHIGKKEVVERATQITVHPTDANTMAIATTKGLYLSKNYGTNFTKLTNDIVITAVSFSPNGEFLIYGHQTLRIYWLSDKDTDSISHMDFLENDFITYLAINPMNLDEIVLATNKKNIFISNNQGGSWQLVAREGKGL